MPIPNNARDAGSGTVATFVVAKPTVFVGVTAYALVAAVSSVLVNRPSLNRVFMGFHLSLTRADKIAICILC